ncbi:short-chain dehydrogenase TIC 32, chloroplastic isoform X3 [Daucus carota subsp. sativus]|uniref:short-chain dehydrogenase TIC 32, chloroplastic isoform X3 n=1 Tax=Daucus carota subsp. sativus TaxID=79200 RepID=UPI003082AEC8
MWIFGLNGNFGFSARSTAEQVTKGVDGTGLVAIVTGATNGIGKETTRVLALRGVHVILGVRNVKAGEKVKEEMLQKHPGSEIDVMEIDLSSQASIRKFAAEFIATGLPLNILINNAGMMSPPFTLSKDNIEQQFAVNHLGPFLLTNLLLDTMKKTARDCGKEGRVVNVASELHRYGYKEGIIFDKINDKTRHPVIAYGQSKLCNILHCVELTRRLKEEGANVTANSLHPGVIATNISQNSSLLACVLGCANIFMKNVPQGAATTCYVALSPKVNGLSGEYFMDSNKAKASSMARDPELAKKLWEFSLTFTEKN